MQCSRNFDQAICVAVAGISRLRGLALLELLLPSENTCLVGLGFRFRNHALALIENRQAGVGENVVGIEFGDAVGDRDGLVVLLGVLIDAGQPMHGVEKRWVGRQGCLIICNGLGLPALGIVVERGVIAVFCGLSQCVVAHGDPRRV